MHDSISITDKTYKKLVIQVSLNGLSFCVVDLLSNVTISLQNIQFSSLEKTEKIETYFEEILKNFPELSSKYDQIKVIHSNNLSTFVPVPLFEEEFLGSYLQYNNKVFETDFFAFDTLENFEINNVYIPYVNMNNFFIDFFGNFDYLHANTILVSNLLKISKNSDTKKMFVHVAQSHFEIVVIQNQKLLFFNTFEFKTPEDFIYYILFTAEQLQLNPENFELELLGFVTKNDDLYSICYKYIRNVTFLNSEFHLNTFSNSENLQHFILLNA